MQNNLEDKSTHMIMKVYPLFLQPCAFYVSRKMINLFNNGKDTVINYGNFRNKLVNCKGLS